jgi:cbb3-type cytochrome oxidase subunit 3
MLTFLTSLVIMFTLVYAGVTWAKRKERRQMAAHEFDGIEEVLRSAADHR